MKIVHQKSQYILGEEIKVANEFERVKGLMFVDKMEGFDGLLIDRCKSIHNFFVRFPIDAIFLTKNYEVVKILRGFKPWRMSGYYFRANMVLELPNKKVPEDIVEGDMLEVVNV